MFAANLGVDRDPPAGVRGLQSLAQALHGHLAQPPNDPDDDRLFVELAGSYLGVVLCDALDQGTHERRDGRHGLRLTSGAFFDPFSAIERVLDGDDIRTALASEVARVEALAHGREDASWQAVKNRLLPRIVGPKFFARLGSELERDQIATMPLHGELAIAFVLRGQGRARYVLDAEVAGWSTTPAVIKHAALSNLARSSRKAQFLRYDSDAYSYVVARTGDGLDSSRVLLPGFRDVLVPELGASFVVAIPHRDALMACAIDAPQAISALRDRAEHEAAHAAHAITDQLFVVEPSGGLRVLAA